MATLADGTKQLKFSKSQTFKHPVHQVEVIKEIIKLVEVPIDRIINHDVFVNVPIEVTKYIDRPIEVIKEIEKIVEIPKLIFKDKIVEIEKIIDHDVEKIVEKIHHQTPMLMKALLILETLLIAYLVIKGH